jgi:hypothetical protein
MPDHVNIMLSVLDTVFIIMKRVVKRKEVYKNLLDKYSKLNNQMEVAMYIEVPENDRSHARALRELKKAEKKISPRLIKKRKIKDLLKFLTDFTDQIDSLIACRKQLQIEQ